MNYILDTLTDEELEKLLRAEDFYLNFLALIKKNSKKYAQFSALLGNMRPNSILVKRNLPGIVVKQFRRKDQNFVKVVEQYADDITNGLRMCIEETTEKKFDVKEVECYTAEEFASIIADFKNNDEAKQNKLNFELLWMQLKLNGIEYDEVKRDRILKLCEMKEIEEAKSSIMTHQQKEVVKSQDDSIDMADEKPKEAKSEKASIKAKSKKQTAKEKAEKNRIALENKAKEVDRNSEIKLNDTEQLANDSREENKESTIIDESVIIKEITANSTQVIRQKGEEKVYYIGKINTIGNFYNFTPIGSYDDGEYSPFTENEVNTLLPKSQKNNINFFYNIWDKSHVDFMYSRFRSGELAVLACEIDQLELNYTKDGQLNETGYKISAMEGCNNGKIQYLSELGLSRLIKPDEIEDDILTKRTVRLIGDSYIENETVLVNLGEGFYAGPYKIKHNSIGDFYYIVTQESSNSAYIVGFNSLACQRVCIETSLDSWTQDFSENYYRIKDGSSAIYKDLLSDKELLDAFVDALNVDSFSEVDGSNVGEIIEGLSDSKIFGSKLPKDVRTERIGRLKAIFSSEQERDDIFSDATEFMYRMLLKSKEDSRTDELLTAIFNKHPEFLDKMQGMRAVQSRLESVKQQIAEAEARAQATESEAERSKQAESELSELDDEINNKKAELAEILERLDQATATDKLEAKVASLQEQEKYLQHHIDNMKSDTKGLEQSFLGLINSHSDKMANITFDGFMASKMLQSAADWEKQEDKEELDRLISDVNAIEADTLLSSETIDYVVNTVQIARPKYDKNTILNIFTCCTQGFLTVFSGMPGCGKTSICNIVAKVIGLTDYSRGNNDLKGVSRFVPVSVERGWTSKRDFVGYYNPLTKNFEENNRDVFNGLKVLNEEFLGNSSKYPFIILLDEANLSPMEYYWADFMNVCDDRDANSFVNMGSDNKFYIPDTLHFLATINNDHTTETLSPRLVDRAWVVTLPKNNVFIRGNDIPGDVIKHLTWQNLRDVFYNAGTKTEYDREVASILDGIKERFSKQSVYLSPRVNMAIFDYWKVASTIMVDDEYGNQPSIIAMDYAIAQKVLPKINGSGEEYEAWLGELKDFCNGKNLMHSADIVNDIINRGNKKMKYYDFFN